MKCVFTKFLQCFVLKILVCAIMLGFHNSDPNTIHYSKLFYKYAYNGMHAYIRMSLPYRVIIINKLTIFKLLSSLINS